MNLKLRHKLDRKTTGETGKGCGKIWSSRDSTSVWRKDRVTARRSPSDVRPCTWNRSQNCAEHNGPNLMGTAGTIGEKQSIAQC